MQENPLNSALQLWLAPWQQAQQTSLALTQSATQAWLQGWQQLASLNPWLAPLGAASSAYTPFPGMNPLPMAGAFSQMAEMAQLAGSLMQGLPLAASVAPVDGDPQAARVSLRMGLPRSFGCMGPAEWLQVEAVVAHRQTAAAPALDGSGAKLVAGEVLSKDKSGGAA